MNEINIIEARQKDKGLRADLFLTSSLKKFSRSKVSIMIERGFIRILSGSLLRSKYIIKGDEKFLINDIILTEKSILPENLPIKILYSDEYLAVIEKPKGLVVHPGAGISSSTLCHALMHHFPDMEIFDEKRPGIVHRLDKDTSGLMVIAKTLEAHQKLSSLFKEKQVVKKYRALIHGEIHEDEFSLITGHVRHPYQRRKFFTAIPAPKAKNTNVRLAHTEVKVLKKTRDISEVIATLHTGRTHQIRAHFADIGHPLLGDLLYGGKRQISAKLPGVLQEAIKNLSGQALHSEFLSFSHPMRGEVMEFISDLPANMKFLSENLDSP